MSKKPSAIQGTKEAAREDVTLRDESDVIIDDLKKELASLQAQLARYRDVGGAPPEEPGGAAHTIRSFDSSLTPHVASRLQIPAEELTLRLQRLIEQISDPELKAELESCQETASFLFDTFRRIGERHEELSASLTADTLVVEAEEFCSRLEASLHDREMRVPLSSRALPRRMAVAPQSVITMLVTLTDLANHIFGRPDRIVVACSDAKRGADRQDSGELLLQIDCGEGWQVPPEKDAVSAVVIRSGVRSRAVVDLLYVEKIIEMRGGSLEFLEREERPFGFEVRLPVRFLE